MVATFSQLSEPPPPGCTVQLPLLACTSKSCQMKRKERTKITEDPIVRTNGTVLRVHVRVLVFTYLIVYVCVCSCVDVCVCSRACARTHTFHLLHLFSFQVLTYCGISLLTPSPQPPPSIYPPTYPPPPPTPILQCYSFVLVLLLLPFTSTPFPPSSLAPPSNPKMEVEGGWEEEAL